MKVERFTPSVLTSPVEGSKAPGSERMSLGGSALLSPPNPCWALDTSSLVCSSQKASSPPPPTQAVKAGENLFGGYAWPRVVLPADVSSIWRRCDGTHSNGAQP